MKLRTVAEGLYEWIDAGPQYYLRLEHHAEGIKWYDVNHGPSITMSEITGVDAERLERAYVHERL